MEVAVVGILLHKIFYGKFIHIYSATHSICLSRCSTGHKTYINSRVINTVRWNIFYSLLSRRGMKKMNINSNAISSHCSL